MTPTKKIKRVYEAGYIAEVEIGLHGHEEPWGPYLDREDVYKLDRVRAALRAGNVAEAMKEARVFRLTPVSAA